MIKSLNQTRAAENISQETSIVSYNKPYRSFKQHILYRVKSGMCRFVDEYMYVQVNIIYTKHEKISTKMK